MNFLRFMKPSRRDNNVPETTRRAEALLAHEENSIREIAPADLEELRQRAERARADDPESARALLLHWRNEADRALAALLEKYDAAGSASETARQALAEMRSQWTRRCYLVELLDE